MKHFNYKKARGKVKAVEKINLIVDVGILSLIKLCWKFRGGCEKSIIITIPIRFLWNYWLINPIYNTKSDCFSKKSFNTLSYSEVNWILIQNYSHYNSIKGNIISHALYYISIGDSSYGTYLLSNEPSLIRRFEDISNPLPPPLPNREVEGELEFPSYYVLFFVVICTITLILLITKKRGKFVVYK